MSWYVIAEHDLSKYGAVRTHILEFSQALSRLEQVTLISYTDQQDYPKTVDYKKISFHPISLRPHNIAFILNTIRLFFFLRRIHRQTKIEVIYVRAAGFGFGPLLFSKFHRVPALVEINGIWQEEQKISLKGKSSFVRPLISLILFLRHLSLVLTCKFADQIIAVTPNIKRYLISLGMPEKKILVVGNGVNTSHFFPHDKHESKKKLNLLPDVRYVGFVGSLSAWQGVDDLVSAFAGIDQPDEIKLLIVGDGAERIRLDRLSEQLGIEEKVIFTGIVPYRLVPYYISACDILVSPKIVLASGYSPLKVYEYLACGRPVLASEVSGLEFIRSNHLGKLFSPGNPVELADKLQELLNVPPEVLETMGNNARKMAVESLSWDTVVQKIHMTV